ncbi:MAG: HAD hydrolase-like protein [Sulfolobales archaeon]|nr:HAD hydrolase-like protein [Sulfolobales archaeon]MCX8199297.1 HAD hydrolase-like protein [Sulfolobales archaeon]MDW8170389.1 HAD hydrolase-like protein [Desulfurococcaceae archaeon]
MAPRLLILDYDLTLVDTIYDFAEAVNESRRAFDLKPLSLSEFLDYFLSDELTWRVAPEGSLDYFWKFFRRIYKTRYGKPIAGATRVLELLKSIGVRNVIVTGREVPSSNVWLELQGMGLDYVIDDVYTLYDLMILGGREESLFDKSWIINHLLNRSSIERNKAVFIGDYWLDALSASKAGVLFIGITSFEKRANDLLKHGACRVVRNFYELLVALYELCRSEVCICENT